MYEEAKTHNMAGATYGGDVRSYAGEAKLAQSAPEIQAQMGDINKNLSTLEAVLSELYKKLTPVSRIEPEPVQKLGTAIGRGTATELGSQLAEMASRIAVIRNGASSVTRRIEL